MRVTLIDSALDHSPTGDMAPLVDRHLHVARRVKGRQFTEPC